MFSVSLLIKLTEHLLKFVRTQKRCGNTRLLACVPTSFLASFQTSTCLSIKHLGYELKSSIAW